MSAHLLPKLNFLALCLLTMTLAALFAEVRLAAEDPYDIEWIQQFGTFRHDEAYDVTVDGLGNAYITGHSRGSLGGPNPNNDSSDAFLAKFDRHGDLLWIEQSSTSGPDVSEGVSLDGLGSVYITGYTGRSASDPRHFLTRYSDEGEFLWTTQDLTPINASSMSLAVSADGLGNAYVAGYTDPPSDVFHNAYLAKYDEAGTLLWTREFGSGFAGAWGVYADELRNVYTSGATGTGLDDYQTFLAKYDAAGELEWTRDFATLGIGDINEADDVVGDGLGNLYITGNIDASDDALLAKFDAAGNLLWHEELGTDQSEYSYSVTTDHQGNVYIAGGTRGSLGGSNAGDWDTFVAKYTPLGDHLWTRQLGTNLPDLAWGISADPLGNIYVAGSTEGSLGGTNAGLSDAFLAKLSPPPSVSLLGDYNNNGLVEQADLDLVLSHWGEELLDPAAVGWLNDVPVGFVDQQELDKVLSQWGSTAAGFTSAVAVPEPTGCMLLVIGASVAFAAHGRRGS